MLSVGLRCAFKLSACGEVVQGIRTEQNRTEEISPDIDDLRDADEIWILDRRGDTPTQTEGRGGRIISAM